MFNDVLNSRLLSNKACNGFNVTDPAVHRVNKLIVQKAITLFTDFTPCNRIKHNPLDRATSFFNTSHPLKKSTCGLYISNSWISQITQLPIGTSHMCHVQPGERRVTPEQEKFEARIAIRKFFIVWSIYCLSLIFSSATYSYPAVLFWFLRFSFRRNGIWTSVTSPAKSFSSEFLRVLSNIAGEGRKDLFSLSNIAGEGRKDLFSLFTLHHFMFKICFSLACSGKFLIRSVVGLPGKRALTWPKN